MAALCLDESAHIHEEVGAPKRRAMLCNRFEFLQNWLNQAPIELVLGDQLLKYDRRADIVLATTVQCRKEVDLLVLASEAEARALTPGHDTCVVTDPRVPVAALIEDDLLLGFPEHGCEDRDACPHASLEAYRAPSPESGDGSSGTRRDSPFAVLEGLAGTADKATNTGR